MGNYKEALVSRAKPWRMGGLSLSWVDGPGDKLPV